ncbi:unnamed protein product [Brassica rapa subsp. narinosa]
MIHNREVLKTISEGESEKEESFVSCTTMMSINEGGVNADQEKTRASTNSDMTCQHAHVN